MHEFSIAEKLISELELSFSRRELNKIERINVKISEYSGVVPESLDLAFSAIKGETLLKKSSLDIDIVPVKLNCRSCGSIMRADSLPVLICSGCGSNEVDIDGEVEMMIDSVEVYD